MMFILCLPLIGTMFIKPDRSGWRKEESDTSIINQRFEICVKEDIGSFLYRPEKMTGLLMYRMIPEDIVFSVSEDYIADADAAQDPEQEYLKALAVVCRSNLVYIWESEQCPDILDYDKTQLKKGNFSGIYRLAVSSGEGSTKLKEIKRAVNATMGAVITKEEKVIAAPFFTTSSADMLVGEPGDGVGFSLNYAYELAAQGMDFYEILKYFFGDIRVNIYE
ncbi:MAG: hypothetical protein J6D08_14750 [Lachnospiraceae bacterium]|nr:hypothetical protein [Lachnospiraceae bacterium]